MEKGGKGKEIPSGAKRKSNPLKVAISFPKSKAPVLKKTRADVKKKGAKLTSNTKKPPALTLGSPSASLHQPLCSSTPKASTKPIPLPSLTAGPSNAGGNGTIQLKKELRIVLERINVNDYISSVKTASVVPPPKILKEKKPKNVKQPKQPETLPDFIVPDMDHTEAMVWQHHNKTKMPHAVAPDLNSSITSIPCDTLKELGIEYPPESKCNRIRKQVTPDTPPNTSPASNSSNQAADHMDVTSDYVLVNFAAPNVSLVSSTSQTDPLDTAAASTSLVTANIGSRVAISHCDLNFGLTERLFKPPKTYPIEELSYYSGDIRRLAPYALKTTSRSEHFYLFAAPIYRANDKFGCLIFGIYENHLVAYGGHFLVEEQRLYDPITKLPADEVMLTNNAECRQHLLLLNIPNKSLLGAEDYCPQAIHPSSFETQLASIEMYMSSISQNEIKVMTKSDVVKQLESNMLKDKIESMANTSGSHETITVLKEPRMKQTFQSTNLDITAESMKRILKNVTSMVTVRKVYGEYGSFQMSCALDPKPQTTHYVAYEGDGIMSFYGTAFILGLLDDRCVVGVLCDDCFFIMATRRVYSRLCGLSVDVRIIGEYQPDMFETIHIPLGVPHQYVLTMLEVRQIFGNPHRYAKEYSSITRALGVAGIRPLPPLSTSDFVYNSNEDSEEERRKWLLQLVEFYFTKTFRESLCNFPSSPVSQENGKLFGETIAKLALHHLLRLADSNRTLQKTPTSPVADWTPKDLFSLDIDAFVAHFSSYFGFSFDSIFQCVRIGADGLPTSVCHHRLSAWAIGNHVQEFHTLQMDSDRAQKELILTPFFLVFQPSLSPPLAHKECDTGLLNWARSTVEHYRGHAYLEVLELVGKLSGKDSDNRKPGPKRAAAKRKRLSTGSETQRVPRPRLQDPTLIR